MFNQVTNLPRTTNSWEVKSPVRLDVSWIQNDCFLFILVLWLSFSSPFISPVLPANSPAAYRLAASTCDWLICSVSLLYGCVLSVQPKETLQLGDRAFIESAVTLMGGYLRATAWTELGNQQVNDAKVGDKIYQSSCKKKLIDELHLFCQRSDWTWLKMYIKVPQLQWIGTMV